MQLDDSLSAVGETALLSVDETKPSEEGGPNARVGFSYQDEVTIGLVLEMLANPTVVKLHCESHDDVVRVSIETDPDGADPVTIAEYIQIKGGETDTLYSTANLCSRESAGKGKDKIKKPGTSLFETSLLRDRYLETSRFRMVTNLGVKSELEVLALPRGGVGREPGSERLAALKKDIAERLPGVASVKKNGADYWCDHCQWDVRSSQTSVRDANLRALLDLARQVNWTILYEQAELLLSELRTWVKAAGEARWEPDRDKKIILRTQVEEWWATRRQELVEGASEPGGGKLTGKLEDIGAEDTQIRMARELRRRYGAEIRTPRYMEDEQINRLQTLVSSALITLRSAYLAGEIDPTGQEFHSLCLKHLDALNAAEAAQGIDVGGFLKGCMYDITDRCLHRFSRPPR